MLTLDVAISTYGEEGIRRTAMMDLPMVDNVSYIVSWQTDDDNAEIPEALQRPDIEAHKLHGRGLSRNRNNSLRHSTADIVLIADDDLRYKPEQLKQVMDIFYIHPELDFATFRFDGGDGKYYPPEECDLDIVPKGYSSTSFELAMRRRVIDCGVEYDTRFGIGTKLAAGEDELMFHTLRHRGFRGRFFPVTITYHDGQSTGFRKITDRNVACAMGAVIGMTYPMSGILRVPLKAWRMHRSGQMPFAGALAALTEGWIHQLFMSRPWKKA